MNNYYDYDWMRINNNSLPNLFDPKNGFKNGNLFRNLYQGYKDYKPLELSTMSEQERKLIELSEIGFAVHELNLYLDLHPEDQSMFMLFQDYQKKENRLKEEYEAMYGPLCIDSNMNDFSWTKNWPWEGNNV